MIHRYPISSTLSLKFSKKPKLCDNTRYLTWKDSRVFLQREAQRITKLLPRAGKHPHTSQISNATAFVWRNARESLQFANLNRDPLNIYAHVYFVERGEIPFAREEVKQTSARRTKPEKFRCSFKPQHKKNHHVPKLKPAPSPSQGARAQAQAGSFINNTTKVPSTPVFRVQAGTQIPFYLQTEGTQEFLKSSLTG